jgi:hypothetical protein
MVRTLFTPLLFLLFATAFGQDGERLKAKIITDEPEAVLNALNKRAAGEEITDADWQRIFSSEGYVRLKRREIAMKRSFEDADFRTFVLSDELASRRHALADTLIGWSSASTSKVAERAFAYLPRSARIRAKVYPVIKPRENSFVFDIPNDPAIFLYLDPGKSKEEFENHLAHELHHIGFGTACPRSDVNIRIKRFPQSAQRVFMWIGGFGEGIAMLAAAGGPDIHPHLFSRIEDRARWDKDVANFNNDLKAVEKFFTDLLEGRLSDDAEARTASSFYGVQGPWYTVGWQMAVVIEKTFGRRKLIGCMCDPTMLLDCYNRSVKTFNKRNRRQLASWSDSFLKQLRRR